MKIAGWILIVLGGLSMVGAASAGHSVFEPIFWLGVGITLLYFTNRNKKQ